MVLGVIVISVYMYGTLVAYPKIMLAFVSVSVSGLLWFTVANGRGFVRLLRDVWLTKRWFKQITGGVSGKELGRIYHLARTEFGRAVLLERVQRRGVVERDEASAGSVQHLALYIDARLAGDPRHPHRSTAQGRFRRFWYMLAAVTDSADWSLSGKYLSSQRDLVYLILEANRRLALTDYAASANLNCDHEEPGTVAPC